MAFCGIARLIEYANFEAKCLSMELGAKYNQIKLTKGAGQPTVSVHIAISSPLMTEPLQININD